MNTEEYLHLAKLNDIYVEKELIYNKQKLKMEEKYSISKSDVIRMYQAGDISLKETLKKIFPQAFYEKMYEKYNGQAIGPNSVVMEDGIYVDAYVDVVVEKQPNADGSLSGRKMIRFIKKMTNLEKVIYWIDNLTNYKKTDGVLKKERSFLWFDLEPAYCAIGTARFIPEHDAVGYVCYHLLTNLGVNTHEVESLNDIIFGGDTNFKRVQEELKSHPGIYFHWELAEQIRKHYES